MTLCMAAVCYDFDIEQHHIAFCSDMRAEVAWAGGDVAFKFAYATKNWPALIAGEISKAHDFLASCRAAFNIDDEPITRDNIFDKFNAISSAHKEKLCRRYTHQRYGISYDRVLANGETELPPEIRARLFYELSEIDYGCEVLIFGFTKRTAYAGGTLNEPHIVEIDKYGEVTMHQNFAAIGAGSIIAKSTMYQREQAAHSTLESTIYRLYEASRLAHRTAPGVGKIYRFQVLDPPIDDTGSVRMLGTNNACLKLLEEAFEAVGPKPFIPLSELDAGNFDSIIPPPQEQDGQPSDSETSEDQP